MDLAKTVTVKQPYQWTQGSWTLKGVYPPLNHHKISLTCGGL